MRLLEMKLIAAGLIIGTAGLAFASSQVLLNEKLNATGSTKDSIPKAAGRASLNVRPVRNKGTYGKFTVAANHLVRKESYDIIVGGAKVGTLTTNGGGNGRATFDSVPRGRSSFLGFDPRGTTVVLRDQTTGTDVLAGTIPDDNSGQACCLTTGQTEDNGNAETECEDMDPTACTTAGGTLQWVLNPDGTPSQTPVTSCLPDPCNNSTLGAPSTVAIACCINSTHDEGTETQCEDYTEAACATAGGMVVQVPGVTPGDGNPCDANPCQAAPLPPSSPPALCCVPQTGSDGTPEPPECEDLTADACTAAGGTPPANGVCDAATPVPCQ